MKYYHFRKRKIWEIVLDFSFQPFMYFVGSKDAHWWDWERIDLSYQELESKILFVGKGEAKRKFKTWPFFSIYNPFGLWCLIQTLFILPRTNVLQPKNFKGEWSLISYKNHRFNKPSYFMITNFLSTHEVKNLSDGKIGYLGMSKEGKIIELELVEVCDRAKHREILFV